MQDLRLVGVHDDGEHLLLTDSSGGEFRVELTAELRRAVRGEERSTDLARGATSTSQPSPVRPAPREPESQMRPREVQALLRAGSTIAEVAERSGWSTEKVERYAAPIQAERDHVAGLVRTLPLRGRNAAAGSTFDDRVSARLVARGVETEQVEWDSWKGESGRWTVVCRFPAGGRQRQATWLFDPTDRTIGATDDEARWLGEDEQTPGPVPAVPSARRHRDAPVYDVEAEGGLEDTTAERPVTVRRSPRGSTRPTQIPAQVQQDEGPDDVPRETEHGGGDPLDLVSAMRERAGRRRRSRRSSRGTTTVSTAASHDSETPDEAQPQEHLDVQHADAPPMGSHPAPEELEDDSTAPSESAAPADEDAPPTVDRIGHDPVTGTADLFADQDLSAPSEPSDAAAQPSDAEPHKAGRRRPRRSTKKTSAPDSTNAGADADADVSVQAPSATDDASADEPPTPRETTTPPSDEHRAQPPARPSSARKGRPAVPSWDDIMFGSRTGPRS